MRHVLQVAGLAGIVDNRLVPVRLRVVRLDLVGDKGWRDLGSIVVNLIELVKFVLLHVFRDFRDSFL